MNIPSKYGGYPVFLLSKNFSGDSSIKRTILFRFANYRKKAYIIQADRFEFDVFVLKFYLRKMKNHLDKFVHQTYDFDGRRIFATCKNVMAYLLSQNPTASFAFMGQPAHDESWRNSQRFRIYRQEAITFFNPEKFEHLYDIENSSHIILNKKNETPHLAEKVVEMFEPYLREL